MIGSVFEINSCTLLKEERGEIKINNNEEYIYRKYFNTGRSTIRYLFKNIIKLTKDEKILVPAYLCDSILQALEDVGCKYEFYNIDCELNIDINDLFDKVNDKVKCIFFIQYFGFSQSQSTIKALKSLSESGIILIEDLTQSLFSSEEGIGIGDYIIASIRKWIKVPDGAILLSKNYFEDTELDNENEEFVSKYFLGQVLKNDYLLSVDNINPYYSYINNALSILKYDKKIRKMSYISSAIMSKYNFEELSIRNSNYKYLYNKLIKIKNIKIIFEYKDNVIPLGFPILAEDKDNLLKFLINNKIFCPVHWPLVEEISVNYKHLNKFNKNVLTIPCDQRYNQEDMQYIIKKIIEFYDERK